MAALRNLLDETTAQFAPRSRFAFKPRTSSVPAGPNEFSPRANTVLSSTVASSARDSAAPPSAAGSNADGATAAEGADTVPELQSIGASPRDYNAEMRRPGPAGAGPTRKPSFSAATSVSLTDHSRLHIILPHAAWRATSSGMLRNLDRCVVDLSKPTQSGDAALGETRPFASLAISDVRNCLIVAGHVAGPAHITGIRDSVVVVAARQVRIHECRNVDFYLYCGSGPIIEDCSNIRFAPLPTCHVSYTKRRHPSFLGAPCHLSIGNMDSSLRLSKESLPANTISPLRVAGELRQPFQESVGPGSGLQVAQGREVAQLGGATRRR